ncbi:MAG: class I SAM-dependent methyltransferase [Deltaproteobacteria bacterium]|nr:class I SAM-dependent methyltransferase [Deltaproteobacteria bacterium]
MRLRRDLRYIADLKDQSKKVRFKDLSGIERTCRVRDFSRTGLSFLLEDGSLIFRIGDIISDLRFYSFENVVHTGSATIIHIQDECIDDKVISRIGCNFENMIDISSIIKVDKVTRLQNEYLDFIHSMAVEDNLDEEFVHLTSHLHFILSNFQHKLKEEEDKILEENDESFQASLLETLRNLTFEALNEVTIRFCNNFANIVERFIDSKEHFIHREFFQKRLNEFFMKSELFIRAYTKPLGYAGDYEMMNIIYRNSFEGKDIFSQVMNKIDCEGAASRAVRNRREYFCKKIQSMFENTPDDKPIRIVSIACGPCLEISDFLSRLNNGRNHCTIEIVAMDQDANALADSQKRLSPLINGLESVSVQYVQGNIKALIVGKEKEKAPYKDADLIYTTGLFDYLSANASNRLILELYSFLKPGGTLIIGNFGMHNPQRFKMEYGSEWVLIHRSEEDLMELTKGLPQDAAMNVEKEPEGINLFLNIWKPGDRATIVSG